MKLTDQKLHKDSNGPNPLKNYLENIFNKQPISTNEQATYTYSRQVENFIENINIVYLIDCLYYKTV